MLARDGNGPGAANHGASGSVGVQAREGVPAAGKDHLIDHLVSGQSSIALMSSEEDHSMGAESPRAA